MTRTLAAFFVLAALTHAESPEWFLQGSAPDPGGRIVVGPGGKVQPMASPVRAAASPGPPVVPACSRAPICGNRFDGPRSGLQRVEWKQTMGYTFAYPVDLPQGGGGVSAEKSIRKGTCGFSSATPWATRSCLSSDRTAGSSAPSAMT